MIEPFMYLGLGFLIAILLALVVLPLVHARAVRLTRRRVEASVPHTLSEVQAEKDQLRAEFAVAARRLEANAEQLKTKTTQQLAELGKKTIALNQLKDDFEQKTKLLAGAEAREQELREKLRETEDGLSLKVSLLEEIERKLKERETSLGNIGREFAERSMTVDSQQIEIVALRTQIATLQSQLLEAQSRSLEKEQQHGREQAQAAVAAASVADVARERDRLRTESEAGKRIQADLREELATIERRYRAAGEQMRTEKAALEGQLGRAREERSRVQQALDAAPKDTTRDSDRVENNLIRDRINEVAAELAHLTALVEGAGSPINKILAEPPAGTARSGLAERIRLLQRRERHPQTPN